LVVARRGIWSRRRNEKVGKKRASTYISLIHGMREGVNTGER
jgi:hypothetical protein